MLTGHDEITDRVKALDAGVDDYLIKPFSIDELMARLRAMHRRAETFSSPVGGSDVNEILKVADLSMNTRTRDVMRGDRAIRLSVKEYDLLNFLMRGAGRVLERQEIMHGVWGENFYGDDNLLDVYIRYLRQKVQLNDAPTLIHTVRGVGFILREQTYRSLCFARHSCGLGLIPFKAAQHLAQQQRTGSLLAPITAGRSRSPGSTACQPARDGVRNSKCRCGPVLRPVLPTRPITSPWRTG